jgi:hypothetical protein
VQKDYNSAGGIKEYKKVKQCRISTKRAGKYGSAGGGKECKIGSRVQKEYMSAVPNGWK